MIKIFKFIFLFNVIIISKLLYCQSSSLNYSKYWIEFTDKNNSSYHINSPQEFLSNRAIQRRTIQKIEISGNDFPVSKYYADSLKKLNAVIINRSRWFNSVSATIPDTAVLMKILALDFVKGIKPVVKMRIPLTDIVLERESYSKTKVNSVFINTKEEDYGLSFNQIEMLNGHFLHKSGFRGNDMVIAVLDAGFKKVDQLKAFDSLRIENRILATWNFVSGNDSVYNNSSHGMNVLSTMAAITKGEIIGTAPKASYVLLVSEDVDSELIIEEDNWVAAVEFADSIGADIVNSSLGYSTFDDTSMNHTYQDMDGNTTLITKAADMAAQKGILVISSAGNEAQTTWKYISAPADGDSVMTVGAVNGSGEYASFSSIGPTSDGRIKPNVAAQGSNAIVLNTGDTISYGSGTSFSAPIIAGLAACLWQAHPVKTNMDIIKAIEMSSSQYLTPDNKLGYGVPDFNYAHQLLSYKGIASSDSIIKIFPNPFNKFFNIFGYNQNSDQLEIEILDAVGKIILYASVDMNTENFFYFSFPDIKNLKQGVYFVRFIFENEIITKKIIKL